MTQEEKDLLFEELSARLPYGLKVLEDLDKTFDGGAIDELKTVTYIHDEQYVYTMHSLTPVNMEEVRPYLRSLLSMSEKEKQELFQLMGNGNDVMRIRFYYSHHLDINCLISKGLALEAPPDMYEIKN